MWLDLVVRDMSDNLGNILAVIKKEKLASDFNVNHLFSKFLYHKQIFGYSHVNSICVFDN